VGGGGKAPPFLTSALDGGEWSVSRRGRFTSRERVPGTHWRGGWMGPRAGLYVVEKRKISCTRRESNPSRPARSQSLYRLSYPARILTVNTPMKIIWNKSILKVVPPSVSRQAQIFNAGILDTRFRCHGHKENNGPADVRRFDI
jgi:hypothetical protein